MSTQQKNTSCFHCGDEHEALPEKPKHTPTPWHLPAPDKLHGFASVPFFDASNNFIGETNGSETAPETDLANAAFIVRAVNAHEALISASKKAESLLFLLQDGCSGKDSCNCPPCIAIRSIREALALAEGGRE